MVMLELELELKWKWQRRQKLWARAPFGYITMMALPLGTNNCFGFGFVFGFGFGFGFRLRLRRLFSVPVCFRVWVFLCVKRVLTESSARGSCESLATGAKMQLCSGLPANIYRFIAVGYGHQ